MTTEAVLEARTDVVADRLLKAAKGAAPAPAVSMVEAVPAVPVPIAAPMPRRKFTTEIPPEGYKALRLAAVMDDVTISDIVSTLVTLWSEDPELAELVRSRTR